MIDHELWQNASDSDIIDHILPRYHDTHRRQLDELIPLAEKVAGVHAGKFPAEMVPLLHTIQGELLSHMMKEERILFPMLKQGAGRAAAMPVRMMMHEHTEHDAAIERLARLQHPDLPPEGVAYTRRVTQIWCGFFALNGSLAALLVLLEQYRWWAVYTGIIAYILMGILMGGEFAYRKWVLKL